ncbi:low temperature requirement protein A [Microbacterium sp. CFBP9034]|uniref:low temperature requirement protein A n=1 Tax=Microbacterium sp. CFBP9034 TaxID=3096540 RepID=UPI002A6ADE11|nr:low temperature requirement protein A [Microbacterium sp. CFBP9034]MDY0908646.1 low temperature requirement protein A [Microbacterium sp. CFBP9034]
MPFGMTRDVMRPTDSPRADRVTYVELFFDLVFVFALTQLSAYLYENQTGLGALEGAIMLCALWWAWVSTTWVTNWLDPVALPVRGAVIALAFVALVISVSIAEAFGERAWAFAIAYVVLQVGRTGFIVWATVRHDRAVARDFALVLTWTAVGAVLWIVGALLPLEWQLPLWAAALGVELLGTILGFPVPGRGRVLIGAWDLSGPHIAERTALFVLITLGEGLLVTGFAFVDKESSPATIAAMATAFVAAAATWWIYFDHGERLGSEMIEASDEPGRVARTAYTWIHLAIIAGLVLLSVGDKESLSHPHEHGLAPTITSLGGPFLFLVGTVLFRRLLEQRWARGQVAGIVALAVLAAVALTVLPLESLTLSAAAAIVLVGVAIGETIGRLRRGRRSGG